MDEEREQVSGVKSDVIYMKCVMTAIVIRIFSDAEEVFSRKCDVAPAGTVFHGNLWSSKVHVQNFAACKWISASFCLISIILSFNILNESCVCGLSLKFLRDCRNLIKHLIISSFVRFQEFHYLLIYFFHIHLF